MELRSTNQPLARRLLGYYLLFGLTSMVVLTVAWGVQGHQVLPGADDQEMLNRVQEVRTLILDDLLKNQGAATKALVQLLSSEDWVAYVGVIAEDGTYLAHSKPGRIGKSSGVKLNSTGLESLVERHVTREDGQRRQELWLPLKVGAARHGYLQVGLVNLTGYANLLRLMNWLPYAVLAPVLVLAIGMLFLRHAARTNAAIEDQLCAVSGGAESDFRLKPLKDGNRAALGWNRLVETALGQRTVSNLESKLSQSLGGLHEKRAERILNSLSDGVAMTDKNGCITYTNRPFSVLLQNNSELSKLRGRPIQEFFPATANLYMSTNQESRPAVFEVQLGKTLADGVLRIGRSPMFVEESSAVAQHLWTVRDVTQQKLADEMRNQFVYSATHELRTPLTNIKAYAETLALNEIADPEQQKSFLNVINSEATRLARFVEELLNVSQMEAGAMAPVRTDVDLDRLLCEVIEKIMPQIESKRIAFEAQIPPKLPKIQVDKDKFIAALVNLLGNAAKYTPDEGRITFKVIVGAKDLQFSIEDTGIGISEDELPKLSTKFFRSADERVRDLPGSGLGLAFTQEVARLHGGKLVIHSELNKGSQFTMVLPLV